MICHRCRRLGSLKCSVLREQPCVISIRLIVLRIAGLRPLNLLVATVPGIVQVGKLELGLIQQGIPDLEILEAWILPGRPEVVLRILEGIVGN